MRGIGKRGEGGSVTSIKVEKKKNEPEKEPRRPRCLRRLAGREGKVPRLGKNDEDSIIKKNKTFRVWKGGGGGGEAKIKKHEIKNWEWRKDSLPDRQLPNQDEPRKGLGTRGGWKGGGAKNGANSRRVRQDGWGRRWGGEILGEKKLTMPRIREIRRDKIFSDDFERRRKNQGSRNDSSIGEKGQSDDDFTTQEPQE